MVDAVAMTASNLPPTQEPYPGMLPSPTAEVDFNFSPGTVPSVTIAQSGPRCFLGSEN